MNHSLSCLNVGYITRGRLLRAPRDGSTTTTARQLFGFARVSEVGPRPRSAHTSSSTRPSRTTRPSTSSREMRSAGASPMDALHSRTAARPIRTDRLAARDDRYRAKDPRWISVRARAECSAKLAFVFQRGVPATIGIGRILPIQWNQRPRGVTVTPMRVIFRPAFTSIWAGTASTQCWRLQCAPERASGPAIAVCKFPGCDLELSSRTLVVDPVLLPVTAVSRWRPQNEDYLPTRFGRQVTNVFR
jgi:hypothetical protein